jgi:hypothetical protein
MYYDQGSQRYRRSLGDYVGVVGAIAGIAGGGFLAYKYRGKILSAMGKYGKSKFQSGTTKTFVPSAIRTTTRAEYRAAQRAPRLAAFGKRSLANVASATRGSSAWAMKSRLMSASARSRLSIMRPLGSRGNRIGIGTRGGIANRLRQVRGRSFAGRMNNYMRSMKGALGWA